MQFSGFVCAASNKSPLTSVQAEGIIDRRLILLIFNKRIKDQDILDFEEIFPYEERKAFVSFATKVDPKTIRKFLLQVRTHPEIARLVEEHYAESGVNTLLQIFIENFITYDSDNWISYGLLDSLPGPLSFSLQKWVDRMDFGKFVFSISKINLREAFLPLVHLKYPSWRDIEDKRRIFNNKKVWGIQGIRIDMNKVQELNFQENVNIPFYLRECERQNWWIKTASAVDIGGMSTVSSICGGHWGHVHRVQHLRWTLRTLIR
uniref:Uncharacterized protein n=1 Tax=Johnson-sea-linkia profunda TaxID=575876 RepID=A0A386AXN6_9CHLO|nr:hypothetical protein [Johnson-sea-linkia profunda]